MDLLKKYINLSFVQFSPKFGDVESNLKTAYHLINKAEPGIIVLPELMNTGYNFKNISEVANLSESARYGNTSKILNKMSFDLKSTIIAGFCERSNNRYYNSAMVLSKGKFLGVYRKIHLFYREKLWFTTGNLGFKIFEVDNIKLGVMICSDWIWPESARTLALKGADVIAHPANLILKRLCQQTMPVRCFENQVYAVTANRIGKETRGSESFTYTGQSQIVAPDMKILTRANSNGNSVRSVKVNVFRSRNKNIHKRNNIIFDRQKQYYLL
ncbi:MAG: acyltransferase [Thaumarchaeota archaeon]|nr:acyltransferase [Nitrososphaerota archaeon]